MTLKLQQLTQGTIKMKMKVQGKCVAFYGSSKQRKPR
jgi:hypothetical protein